MCDVAEYRLRRKMENEDMLRLLAGFAGAENYQPPGERLADALDDLQARPALRRDPQARRSEVSAFIAAAGGEG